MKLSHIVFVILLAGAAVQAGPLLQSTLVQDGVHQVDAMPISVQIKCILSIGVGKDVTATGRRLTRQAAAAAIQTTGASLVDYPSVVANLLNYLPFLSAATRAQMAACKLDLSKALTRCEAVHGKGNCDQTETGAQKKCPTGLKRFGSGLCTVSCPKNFEEMGYYCLKNQFPKSAMFDSKKLCEERESTACESWVGAFWVAKCNIAFKRVGANQCVLRCPDGWTDSGRICFKPSTSTLGAPFNWIITDN